MGDKAYPIVVMETTMGKMKIELWDDFAPITVHNFLSYAHDGFYEGTIFHRVINSFLIQGGGLTPDMREKSAGMRQAIRNEAKESGIKNTRGTIAMARKQEIDSATSQFFINVSDNEFLNYKSDSPKEFGYSVFGQVFEGMDIVDKISLVKTSTIGPYHDVPAKPILISRVKLM